MVDVGPDLERRIARAALAGCGTRFELHRRASSSAKQHDAKRQCMTDVPFLPPQAARRARLHPPGDRRRGARRAGGEGGRHRLHRLRRDRAEPSRRQPGPDHDAAPAAAGRPQADRADGRRDDQGRRSVGQGREPQAAHRRGDRRQHRRHPPGVRALPDLRRRADRRRHGQQCRMARRARVHPVPARGRAGISRSTGC